MRFIRVLFIVLTLPTMSFGQEKTIRYRGAPDKPCGVGRADANPKLLLNDT